MQPSDANIANKHSSKEYWVSDLYLQCIKEELPCECTSQAEFSLLVYTRKTSDIFVYEYQSGFEELKVKAVGDKYEVYTNLNNLVPFFKMEIIKDTLYLMKDGVKTMYVNYPELKGCNEKDLVGQLNMKIMIDALVREDVNISEIIQKMKIEEATCFYCNYELEKMNLVSTKNDCENMWIVESSDKKILIYDYLNSCSSKTYPISIEKVLMCGVQKN